MTALCTDYLDRSHQLPNPHHHNTPPTARSPVAWPPSPFDFAPIISTPANVSCLTYRQARQKTTTTTTTRYPLLHLAVFKLPVHYTGKRSPTRLSSPSPGLSMARPETLITPQIDLVGGALPPSASSLLNASRRSGTLPTFLYLAPLLCDAMTVQSVYMNFPRPLSEPGRPVLDKGNACD
ncbi:hypothetical protein IF2G_00408 [Cordyceps javanica]|nr:hypothetical protein IF2G_00408 [Cordyceps javanica]